MITVVFVSLEDMVCYLMDTPSIYIFTIYFGAPSDCLIIEPFRRNIKPHVLQL